MTYGFLLGVFWDLGTLGVHLLFLIFLGLQNRPIGCFGKFIVVLVYGMANINAGVLTCQEKNILFEK